MILHRAGPHLFTLLRVPSPNMLRGKRGKLPPRIDDIETYWTPAEKAQASRMLACSFVGSPDTVRQALHGFVDHTGADELMVACALYDHEARKNSYRHLAAMQADFN